jgi:membrane-associated phospholipid phosphatase
VDGDGLLVALTGFGDAALLLPLAAAILIWLLSSRAPRAAAWWAIAVFICGGVTAVLKILFWGCPPVSDLHSPSGHTALSTLVYGALALITAVEGGRWRLWLAAAAGGALIVGIGVSRLLLDVHSIPEVIIGWLIGGASLVLFRRGYWQGRPQIVHLAPLLFGVSVLAVVLHGSQLRAEGLLHRITGYLDIHCR